MANGHRHLLPTGVDLLAHLRMSRNGVKPLAAKLERFEASRCRCGYLVVTAAPKPHMRLTATEDREALQIAADVVGDGGVLLP